MQKYKHRKRACHPLISLIVCFLLLSRSLVSIAFLGHKHRDAHCFMLFLQSTTLYYNPSLAPCFGVSSLPASPTRNNHCDGSVYIELRDSGSMFLLDEQLPFIQLLSVTVTDHEILQWSKILITPARQQGGGGLKGVGASLWSCSRLQIYTVMMS